MPSLRTHHSELVTAFPKHAQPCVAVFACACARSYARVCVCVESAEEPTVRSPDKVSAFWVSRCILQWLWILFVKGSLGAIFVSLLLGTDPLVVLPAASSFATTQWLACKVVSSVTWAPCSGSVELLPVLVGVVWRHDLWCPPRRSDSRRRDNTWSLWNSELRQLWQSAHSRLGHGHGLGRGRGRARAPHGCIQCAEEGRVLRGGDGTTWLSASPPSTSG